MNYVILRFKRVCKNDPETYNVFMKRDDVFLYEDYDDIVFNENRDYIDVIISYEIIKQYRNNSSNGYINNIINQISKKY